MCWRSASRAWCGTCTRWRRDKISVASTILLVQIARVMRSYLDFEKPVAELEAKVEELRALQEEGDAIAIGEEIGRIEAKAAQALAAPDAPPPQ